MLERDVRDRMLEANPFTNRRELLWVTLHNTPTECQKCQTKAPLLLPHNVSNLWLTNLLFTPLTCY